MGFLGGLLGSGNGADFKASGVDLMNPATMAQANQAYDQTQGGLSQQQAFVNALGAQNGLANQANVFGQQQGLANQFQNVANGTGPNPALAQLNQTTGQNIAQQASLMAGQRGANANVGLMARQAAMQGGNLQQQALGQGATLQAQQQLAGMNALQGQQAQMAQLAGTQVGQQQQGLSAYNQLAQQGQANTLNAINAQNQNAVSMQGNINSANAGIAQQNAKSQGSLFGGLLSGAGLSSSKMNQGGMVGCYAGGGMIGQPMSMIGQMSLGINPMVSSQGAPIMGGNMGSLAEDPQLSKDSSQFSSGLMKTLGGEEAAGTGLLAGAGEVAIPAAVMVASKGGKVPGKPEVMGDNEANDTVPAMLSPGEIVIPRSVMESGDPIKGAAAFVQQLLSQGSSKKQNFATGGMSMMQDPGGMGGASAQSTTQDVVQNTLGNLPTSQAMTGQSGGEIPLGAMAPQSTTAALTPMSQTNIPMGQSDSATAPYEKAFGEQRAGIGAMANAEGALGKEQAKAYQQGQADLKTLDTNYQKSVQDLNTERQNLMNDYKNQTIDPQRFLHNQSTGQKIATGIGLILGGMGAGLTGGENPVMKHLDNQINADIDSQKASLGKTSSLLDMNMKQYGNIRDAMAATKSAMLDGLKFKIEENASKSNDPLVKARAMQAMGQLDQQSAQILGPIAQRQALLKSMNPQMDPAKVVETLVPKEHQKDVFEEIGRAQNINKNSANILDAFDKAASQIKILPGDRNGVKSFHQLLLPNFKSVDGTVRQAAMDETFHNLTPQALDSPGTLASKRKGVEQWMQSETAAPTAKGYGIDLQNFASTSSNPEMRLDPQTKGYADWARQTLQRDPGNQKAQLTLKKLGLK